MLLYINVLFMSIWRGYILFILNMMTSGFIKKIQLEFLYFSLRF